MMRATTLLTATAMLLGGCNLAPDYVRPDAPVTPDLPTGPAYNTPAAAGAGQVRWESVVIDRKLTALIDLALTQNRDLRAALASVASARALYGGSRAAFLPSLSANLSGTLSRGPASTSNSSYDLNASLSSFEIDLFGKLRNESESAFQTYLASEEGARASRTTLVAEVATAYVTYAYDLEILRIAADTAASAGKSLQLSQSLHDSGLAQGLDVAQAETVLRQAQSDVASNTTQLAQDRNALVLLVGAPVEDALLPDSLTALDASVRQPPAALSSNVLLVRPDVLQAEHQLQAANADIGAARAAFFPTISLTSMIGLISPQLSSLFSGGNWVATAAPSISAPIFNLANQSNLEYTEAQRDLYVAQYEKAVQTAFREVADALARAGTINDQRAAQTALVAASERSAQLSDARYRSGIDTFLTSLTAQRTLYAARQSAAATVLAAVTNRLELYRSLAASY